MADTDRFDLEELVSLLARWIWLSCSGLLRLLIEVLEELRDDVLMTPLRVPDVEEL